MQTEALLDLNIFSDPHGVRRGLDRVNTALAANGCTPDMRGSAEILLAEIMNNIVEHAYAARERGSISVMVTALRTALRFQITDNGVPLPEHAVRPKNHDLLNTELADLPEGGFGWGLIQTIATNLEYRRKDGRNILSFDIPYAEDEITMSFEEQVRLQNQNGG